MSKFVFISALMAWFGQMPSMSCLADGFSLESGHQQGVESIVTQAKALGANIKAEEGRLLAPGEIRMVEEIFHDGIDYQAVRVFDNLQDIGAQFDGLASGNNIYFQGKRTPGSPGVFFQISYSDDFSNPNIRSVTRDSFIHELAHVWQYQHLGRFVMMVNQIFHQLVDNNDYFYLLDSKKSLLAYNIEQQATIIQDYFRILHDENPTHLINQQGDLIGSVPNPKETYQQMYESFLADFLKDSKNYVEMKAGTLSPGAEQLGGWVF